MTPEAKAKRREAFTRYVADRIAAQGVEGDVAKLAAERALASVQLEASGAITAADADAAVRRALNTDLVAASQRHVARVEAARERAEAEGIEPEPVPQSERSIAELFTLARSELEQD